MRQASPVLGEVIEEIFAARAPWISDNDAGVQEGPDVQTASENKQLKHSSQSTKVGLQHP